MVPQPFQQRRLEPARELIASTYGYSTRTAARYLRSYAEMVFRLRGRRLPVSGKGGTIMFTEDDWHLFTQAHLRMSEPSSTAIGDALADYLNEVGQRAGEPHSFLEVLASLRAEVREIGQVLTSGFGEPRVSEPSLEQQVQSLSATVQQQALVLERQQALLTSQASMLETLVSDLRETSSHVTRTEEGLRVLMEWLMDRDAPSGG